ncbi:MAG: PepSY domain-containing protein [Faecalibacterium sp.]
MKRILPLLISGLLLAGSLSACTAQAVQTSAISETTVQSAVPPSEQISTQSAVPVQKPTAGPETENTAAQSKPLDEASARQKALALAGLQETDITGLRSKLKTEDGTDLYEIKFTDPAANAEYEYCFRVPDGVLLNAEYEREGKAPSGNAALREEDAKQRALELTGLKAENVSFTRCKLENDYGLLSWELHFHSSSAGYRYELELSAVDGSVLNGEQELMLSADVAAASTATVSLNVSADAAKKTALDRVPGAGADSIRKCNLENEDGRLVYEIELEYNGTQYECVLDASTGKVLEWEIETKLR